ncbi:unnamed protein product [Durusdinium trenchii]|uniref:Uncharacterized protein n=2 Tax=Durusdinium trenchii TaxID=1381693 RepID=A0ABP0M399_9DINO
MFQSIFPYVVCLCFFCTCGIRPHASEDLGLDVRSSEPPLQHTAKKEPREAAGSIGHVPMSKNRTQERLMAELQREVGRLGDLAPAPRRTCRAEMEALRAKLKLWGLDGNGSPCGWRGVTCHDCAVTRLSFYGWKNGVGGDVAALQEMHELQSLNLAKKNFSGDIVALRNLTKLRWLSISGTRVTGEVESLQNLTSLRHMNAWGSQLFGNVAAFQNMHELSYLQISVCHLIGSITSITGLRRLKVLNLERTQVTGPIKALEGMAQLGNVQLQYTNVTGDISALQHLKRLHTLRLQNTQIFGDISALKGLWLKMLKLWNTNVTGDIMALRSMTRLVIAYLGDTQITGDVSSLKHVTKLKQLYLQRTGITGQISALQGMKDLQELLLQRTKVRGSLELLRSLPALVKVDLSQTQVVGWISSEWQGCCEHLIQLNLADSHVSLPANQGRIRRFDHTLLPALQTLVVSGCSLNGTVSDLLLPLARTPLSKIVASRCNLHGDVPQLDAIKSATIGSVTLASWRSPLADTLQTIDLSNNYITALDTLPSTVRVDLHGNKVALNVGRKALLQAARGVELNLKRVNLSNPTEARELLSKEITLAEAWTLTKESEGYVCKDFVQDSIRVTPELFLPNEMCNCTKGYAGTGTNCSSCPADSFSAVIGSAKCEPCPQHASARKGSTSVDACECSFGVLTEWEGFWSCQCERGWALSSLNRCTPCSELKLRCAVRGSIANESDTEFGFSRLEANAEKAYQCLEPKHCKPSGCAGGYEGLLCSDCKAGYRVSKRQCVKCADHLGDQAKHLGIGLLVLILALMALLSLGFIYAHRSEFSLQIRYTCAAQLLASQGAGLLQLAQLWVILAGLSSHQSLPVGMNVTEVVPEESGDSWVANIGVLQLSAMDLQSFLSLQCQLDGRAVRSMAALVTPLLPLLLLACCGCVEVCAPGVGISMALKVVTVLFIGGASGSTQLLECQEEDGAGQSLGRFAFRPLFPHLLCSEQTEEAVWVDAIGRVTGVCYAVVIPSLLAFIFAKQHVLLRQSKTFIARAQSSNGNVTLQLCTCEGSQPIKENLLEKRLVAAAAAQVALHHAGGRARIRLREEMVIVSTLDKHEEDADFSVEHLTNVMLEGDEKEAHILNCNSIVQMLTERSILDEIKSDRWILGAKQVLCKYATCRDVWVEVCSKVVSVTLVSVVAAKDGVWLSITLTLSMALVIGIVRPFAQSQVNTLQSFCFFCLSVAAVGFKWYSPMVARAALSTPFLLLALQMLRPDCTETLALRLQKARTQG